MCPLYFLNIFQRFPRGRLHWPMLSHLTLGHALLTGLSCVWNATSISRGCLWQQSRHEWVWARKCPASRSPHKREFISFVPNNSLSISVHTYQELPACTVFYWRWLSGKEFACNAGDAGDAGSIPGSGRSPGGGHGNPPQYSCLENPMDRGAWRATVHGMAKSQTRLKWLRTQTCSIK